MLFNSMVITYMRYNAQNVITREPAIDANKILR